jgi:hypothetical protein
MKLGWLSRLGIVLTLFGIPVGAASLTYWQLSENQKGRDAQWQLCLEIARQDSGQRATQESDKCYDEWEHAPTDAGSIWWEAFAFTAAAFAVLWVFAIAVYWSVVWILAGRRRAVE